MIWNTQFLMKHFQKRIKDTSRKKGALRQKNIIYSRNNFTTFHELKMESTMMILKHKVDYIIIDNLNSLTDHAGKEINLNFEVKKIAHELNKCTIGLI